jgi:hypothetical protein
MGQSAFVNDMHDFNDCVRSLGRVLGLLFFLPSFNSILVYHFLGQLSANLAFGIVNPETNYDIKVCENLPNKCLEKMSCSYLNSIPESRIIPVRTWIRIID